MRWNERDHGTGQAAQHGYISAMTGSQSACVDAPCIRPATDSVNYQWAFEWGNQVMSLSNVMRKLWLGVAALAFVAHAGLASGQDAGTTKAMALEEVVVTAQKREQNVQDVPIFVSVISSEKLDSSNIMNFNELSKIVPGIIIDGPIDGFGSTIRIRGIGVQRYIEGIRPSIGVFVDDVPYGRIDNAFTNFLDIDSVEVLKGPQATLFGKEVSSGAIVIRTKKPNTTALKGDLEANLGNFGLQEYRGAINVPIGSATAARFSGYWTTRDGQIENIVTGKKGEMETWGARASFLRKIGDDVEATLTFERHEAQARNALQEVAAYGRNTLGFAVATGVTLFPANAFDRKVQAASGQGRDQTFENAALDVSWKINDAWTFKSVTGYQDFVRHGDKGGYPGGGNDRTNGLFGAFTYIVYTGDKVLSQELNLTYEGDSLSSVLGVYYEDGKWPTRTDMLIRTSPSIQTPLLSYGDRTSNDLGIYAHNIYKFYDRWTLTAGLRYSEVKKDDVIINVSRGGFYGSVSLPASLPHQKDTWSAVSGTAKLSYRMNEDTNIYGGYDRGFKAGAHNLSSSIVPPPVKEEIVDSFEVGVKGLAFGRSLRWAVSLFDQKYTDFQVTSPSPLGSTSLIQNAASVDISGVEAEVTWMANDNFTLNGALAYIDSKYGDFKIAPCTDLQKSVTPTNCTQDLSGKRVDGNPPLTWNLGAQYKSALPGSRLALYLRGELVYRDEMQGTVAQDLRTVVNDYTLVNASVGLLAADGAWDLSLWGKNLNDEDYVSYYDLALDGAFGLLAELGDSRTYGINLKYKF